MAQQDERSLLARYGEDVEFEGDSVPAREVSPEQRRRLCRQWATASTVGGLAFAALLALVARAGFFQAASTSTAPRLQGLQAMAQKLTSGWREGTSCLKGCGGPGYCQWCGHGVACCELGAPNAPLECRGIGGAGYLSCTAVRAGEHDQCGGASWQGAQLCAPGLECHYIDASYSECRRHLLLEPAPAYKPCLWQDAGSGKQMQALCVPGTICRDVPAIHGFSKRLCLPAGLLNPGENCLAHCGAGGSCAGFCGKGNACCEASNDNDPYECHGALGFLTAHHECIVPAAPAQSTAASTGLGTLAHGARTGLPAPQVGRTDAPGEVLHWSQACLPNCGGSAGACDWCGVGNACCMKNAFNDPPECAGITLFGSTTEHTCVKPVSPVAVYHQKQNCWPHCKKSGYCDWCGIGNACCEDGTGWKPNECQGVRNFPTSSFHTCVLAVPGTGTECMPGTERNDGGECVKPATPKPFTFYMYQATSAGNSRDDGESSNMGSLAGVMWYVHNEILGACPRRSNLTSIRRFKVTMTSTRQLYFATMRYFGPFSAFDYGKCASPDCDASFGKYGYVVGCQQLSTSVAAYSPNPTLFSLPGACPDAIWEQKTPDCKRKMPGGACPNAEAVGTGTCTYHAEPAGEVDISRLAGIADYADFCEHGNREYMPDWDRGRGTTFWDGKRDPAKCRARINALQMLFHADYPNMPTTFEEPLCDSAAT